MKVLRANVEWGEASKDAQEFIDRNGLDIKQVQRLAEAEIAARYQNGLSLTDWRWKAILKDGDSRPNGTSYHVGLYVEIELIHDLREGTSAGLPSFSDHPPRGLFLSFAKPKPA